MIERFTKRAGDGTAQSVEDPSMSLVGDATPDEVRMPPDLGGGVARVTHAFTEACPVCRSRHPIKHLALDGGVFVAECSLRGFLWYRRR